MYRMHVGLDDLSSFLKEEGYTGQAILFLLVFLTTFRMYISISVYRCNFY